MRHQGRRRPHRAAPRIARMNSKAALGLACLSLLVASAAGAQNAPRAPAAAASAQVRALPPVVLDDPRDRDEPNVRRTVIEDQGSKIEELNVRGQPQRIVVTPKVGTTKSYEIIPDSSGRAMYDGSGASRGAVGKRVWNVFDF